jgi:hypothetical protein
MQVETDISIPHRAMYCSIGGCHAGIGFPAGSARIASRSGCAVGSTPSNSAVTDGCDAGVAVPAANDAVAFG